MKTSLVVIGVIFLVIGGLLYFVPMQEFSAKTQTTGTDGSDVRTSSASVNVPPQFAVGAAITGLILLILGFVIPGTRIVSKNASKEDSYKVVQVKEDIELGKGDKRKIFRERSEKYVGKNETV